MPQHNQSYTIHQHPSQHLLPASLGQECLVSLLSAEAPLWPALPTVVRHILVAALQEEGEDQVEQPLHPLLPLAPQLFPLCH